MNMFVYMPHVCMCKNHVILYIDKVYFILGRWCDLVAEFWMSRVVIAGKQPMVCPHNAGKPWVVTVLLVVVVAVVVVVVVVVVVEVVVVVVVEVVVVVVVEAVVVVAAAVLVPPHL